MKKNLVIFFPGIGYSNDKPLLYYTRKFLLKNDWQVINVNYSGFPENILGNEEKILLSQEIAFEQAEICLQNDDFSGYQNIAFVSKSIGTVAAAKFAFTKKLNVKHIFFTPLEQTFNFNQKNAIIFHGTSDVWIKTQKLQDLCKLQNFPLNLLNLYENANHSLETGDIFKDIDILKNVMEKTQKFLLS